MADSAAAAAAPMTIDFLRARLLSERSVSRASKERADQLATRVAELEEQVRAVTAQRRQAEREAAEVLAILESKGFEFGGSLSDALDSGSDDDANGEAEETRPRDANTTGGDHGKETEQEPAAAKTEADDDAPSSGTAAGGLSWKGRSVSPRKARQLRQRHRRSYVYLLASDSEDPSPKYRMGQSCRKNKRKELSSGRSAPPEEGGDAVLTAESREGQRDGSEYTDDGRAELDDEAGGDERSSADGGQYVMRCEKDGEMERVLEKQAELIGQYEAEEKAQRDWEKQFNHTRSSPEKGDVVQAKPNGNTLSIAISAQGSSNNSSTSQGKQGDANSEGCPSHTTSSATSGHKSSPSSDTLVSKVSDWSCSRFHDQTDDQLDARPCRQSSGANDIDVESVLQALQRARISLQQKLGRPLPPSQVTLALPAPGDEHRDGEDRYDGGGSSSYRGEPSGSSPSRHQEMLALPAPEDYHSCHDHDHGSASLSADGGDTSSLAERRSGSSPPRQEILALPAPGDDGCVTGVGEDDVDVKIPVSSPGLFRLPRDSFPEDETLSRSSVCDFQLGLRETIRYDAYKDDDAGVSAKQFYDPPASGRCNVQPSSGFTTGGASFLSGIPGLPEELRRGRSLGDADLFMQRACDYTISNKWML